MDGTGPDQGSFDDLCAELSKGDDDADLAAQSARFFQDRAREAIGQTPMEARAPCPDCNSVDALRESKGGQWVVRCRKCGKHLYNAPKAEIGERRRSVQSLRPSLKPKTQQRILERDGQACVLCHRDDVPLAIGHVLSIKDAATLGESGPWLNSPENLVTMCEACNLGLGEHSLLPVTYLRIVLRLLKAAEARTSDAKPSPALSETLTAHVSRETPQ